MLSTLIRTVLLTGVLLASSPSSSLSAITDAAQAQPAAVLEEAAKRGNVETANAALSKGADANARGEHGLTPLMWAALYGHTDVVEVLLAAGATANLADGGGGTALAYARLAGHAATAQAIELRGGTVSFGTSEFDAALKSYMWTMSRPSSIFDYVNARAKERQAKEEAALQANWAASLIAPLDLRGRWTFDPKASDYGKLAKPKSVEYVILQTPNQLVRQAKIEGKTQDETYELDGSQAINDMGSSGRTLTTAVWEGATLILRSSLHWDGVERAAQEERWSLSVDGATLTIERVATKPVAVRVRQVMTKQK